MASHGTAGNSAAAVCQTESFNAINPPIPHSNEQEIAAICGRGCHRFAPNGIRPRFEANLPLPPTPPHPRPYVCVTLPPPPRLPSCLRCPSQQPLALQIQPLISDLGGCLTQEKGRGSGASLSACTCARTDAARVGRGWPAVKSSGPVHFC